jgi:hypothetical protein
MASNHDALPQCLPTANPPVRFRPRLHSPLHPSYPGWSHRAGASSIDVAQASGPARLTTPESSGRAGLTATVRVVTIGVASHHAQEVTGNKQPQSHNGWRLWGFLLNYAFANPSIQPRQPRASYYLAPGQQQGCRYRLQSCPARPCSRQHRRCRFHCRLHLRNWCRS